MENSGIKTALVRIEGASPLLMHNGQLANPLNEWVSKIKVITSKHHSKKTESDIEELMRLEFQGGLYYDEDKKAPMIPDIVVEGAIRDAAKGKRKGQAVTAGLNVYPEKIPLIYKGTKDRDGLYEDRNFVDSRMVKLQKSASLIRTRPRFDKWELEFEIKTIDEILSMKEVADFLATAGTFKGIGDYRPKFGRFIVKEFEVV